MREKRKLSLAIADVGKGVEGQFQTFQLGGTFGVNK